MSSCRRGKGQADFGLVRQRVLPCKSAPWVLRSPSQFKALCWGWQQSTAKSSSCSLQGAAWPGRGQRVTQSQCQWKTTDKAPPGSGANAGTVSVSYVGSPPPHHCMRCSPQRQQSLLGGCSTALLMSGAAPVMVVTRDFMLPLTSLVSLVRDSFIAGCPVPWGVLSR